MLPGSHAAAAAAAAAAASRRSPAAATATAQQQGYDPEPRAALAGAEGYSYDVYDSASESEATLSEETPQAKAGPAAAAAPPLPGTSSVQLTPQQGQPSPDDAGRKFSIMSRISRKSTKKSQHHPNVPAKSYALENLDNVRTNLGHTDLIMAFLAEAWMLHAFIILGGTYLMNDWIPQKYSDDVIWNRGCYWKLCWLLPLPYTFISFFGLVLPFRTPKYLYDDPSLVKRRVDNLYILTVTKGDNREAVYRSWNAHKHLESLFPEVRVHVLTDEPYFFENINCYTCPKAFRTAHSKYKARALEWYRQTMRYTEYDWVLHLDEESVVDDASVRRILEFIYYEHACSWGQGVILYNQYRYWKNWFFTVADALRVADDIARFHLQYTYFKRPIFGAHGSFLLSNGAVENAVTWDLGSLTEDYQFAMHAWESGFKCGKIPALIREQSPLDLIGFMKQRRRWFVGIRRLPLFLPKVWSGLWALGVFCIIGTIVSIVLGLVIDMSTPRWFGLLKDFSFITFVYLYVIGIFIEDIDKGLNPFIIIIHIPMTIVLQFAAAVMEGISIAYALILPPADFDVIKK